MGGNELRQTAGILSFFAILSIYMLIARAIHEASARSKRPLIRVNCATVPHELFESEFFGHAKGTLAGAARDRTGRGQHIDMALYDTQISVLGNQNLNYLVSGNPPVQMGNAHMNISPYEVLPVKDGFFILAVGNDGQFQRFCKVVGLDRLTTDPDFATNPARVANRVRLRETIIETLESWERDRLLPLLDAAAVPASPINDIAQMFADPHTIARGMRLDIKDAHGTELPSVRAPMVMGGTPLRYERPSPRLGEHTAEILAELEKQKK